MTPTFRRTLYRIPLRAAGRTLRLLPLLVLLTLSAPAALAEADDATAVPLFAEGEHCLAYRTVKGMFWLFDTAIVGKNCAVNASLQPGPAPESVVVEVTAGVASFESGNSLRDEHVAELLGAEQHPTLRFRSETVLADLLRPVLAGGVLELHGTLELAGRENPVVFALQVSGPTEAPVVTGRLRTRFEDLDITVPRVGPGGLIAAPSEELDLMAQLHLIRVHGAEALLWHQVARAVQ